MPRSLEPPLEPDEFIDGLRRAENPPGFKATMKDAWHASRTNDRPSEPTQSLKQHGSGLTAGRRGATIAGILLLGILCGATGAMYGHRPAESESVPAPAETVTVTVTVPAAPITEAQPQACVTAIKAAAEILELASEVASASDKQLDIMSSAYVAIFEKDTAALNAAADRQRNLERSLSTAAVPTMLQYQSVMNGLSECKL